mgnify:CR=1 FL=1
MKKVKEYLSKNSFPTREIDKQIQIYLNKTFGEKNNRVKMD